MKTSTTSGPVPACPSGTIAEDTQRATILASRVYPNRDVLLFF